MLDMFRFWNMKTGNVLKQIASPISFLKDNKMQLRNIIVSSDGSKELKLFEDYNNHKRLAIIDVKSGKEEAVFNLTTYINLDKSYFSKDNRYFIYETNTMDFISNVSIIYDIDNSRIFKKYVHEHKYQVHKLG